MDQHEHRAGAPPEAGRRAEAARRASAAMARRRCHHITTHIVQSSSLHTAATDAAGPVPPAAADLGRVPVVDVAPFFSPQPAAAAVDAVSRAVARACAEVGFLVVIGHGVPAGLAEACAAEAGRFFAQPEPVKLAVAARGGAFGYIPLNSEALGDGGASCPKSTCQPASFARCFAPGYII